MIRVYGVDQASLLSRSTPLSPTYGVLHPLGQTISYEIQYTPQASSIRFGSNPRGFPARFQTVHWSQYRLNPEFNTLANDDDDDDDDYCYY